MTKEGSKIKNKRQPTPSRSPHLTGETGTVMERQQDGKKRGGSQGSEEIKVTGPGAFSSLGQKEWTIRKFFRRKALSKGRDLRITCLRAKAI